MAVLSVLLEVLWNPQQYDAYTLQQISQQKNSLICYFRCELKVSLVLIHHKPQSCCDIIAMFC